MTAPVVAADSRRDASIESLLENANVRPSVKHRARKISAACDRLIKQSRPLTISNISEVARELYPDDYIASSTIWNRTAAGEIYRGVVDAWKVWLLAMGQAKSSRRPAVVGAEIPDSVITRIEPPEARLMVLLLRETLRNTRSQLNGLRSLTSDRLIRQGTASKSDEKTPATTSFSKADLATLEAFINEHELRLRGFYWGPDGELIVENGSARSGPGVKDALVAAVKRLKP